MDRIELYLGVTIFFEGEEYVIAGIHKNIAPDGRSLDIKLLEPLYAQRNKIDSENRRDAVLKTLEHLEKVNKLIDS